MLYFCLGILYSNALCMYLSLHFWKNRSKLDSLDKNRYFLNMHIKYMRFDRGLNIKHVCFT